MRHTLIRGVGITLTLIGAFGVMLWTVIVVIDGLMANPRHPAEGDTRTLALLAGILLIGFALAWYTRDDSDDDQDGPDWSDTHEFKLPA